MAVGLFEIAWSSIDSDCPSVACVETPLKTWVDVLLKFLPINCELLRVKPFVMAVSLEVKAWGSTLKPSPSDYIGSSFLLCGQTQSKGVHFLVSQDALPLRSLLCWFNIITWHCPLVVWSFIFFAHDCIFKHPLCKNVENTPAKRIISTITWVSNFLEKIVDHSALGEETATFLCH